MCSCSLGFRLFSNGFRGDNSIGIVFFIVSNLDVECELELEAPQRHRVLPMCALIHTFEDGFLEPAREAGFLTPAVEGGFAEVREAGLTDPAREVALAEPAREALDAGISAALDAGFAAALDAGFSTAFEAGFSATFEAGLSAALDGGFAAFEAGLA